MQNSKAGDTTKGNLVSYPGYKGGIEPMGIIGIIISYEKKLKKKDGTKTITIEKNKPGKIAYSYDTK